MTYAMVDMPECQAFSSAAIPFESDPLVVDLFAGPGGWDTGLRIAGYRGRLVGVEWDKVACLTARAAGHDRLQFDVSLFVPEAFGRVWGLIASPPCQGFSSGGKGLGRADAVLLLEHLAKVENLDDLVAAIAFLREHMADPRSLFALEPLRYALALTPVWSTWEQVPAVQPIWDACANILRRLGYTVATGVLNAERYGVPQTRKRAVLVAHRADMPTPAALPTATRSAYYSRTPDKLDPGVDRWMSMAEALGWGMLARPYPTIAAGTANGGTDPQAIGGSGARASIQAERDAGRWIEKMWDDGPETWDRPFNPPRYLAPAGTSSTQVDPRPVTAPAPTITGKGTAEWGNRPHRAEGPKNRDPSGKRVSVAEAAILQSFPVDYPWQGSKTDQYRQVGDAVPPRLAAAILEPILAATRTTRKELTAA